MIGNINGINGGVFYTNGDLYIKNNGYSSLLTNQLNDIYNKISSVESKYTFGTSINSFHVTCENVPECGGWCYVITFGYFNGAKLNQGVQLAFQYMGNAGMYFASYCNGNLTCQWTKVC